MEIVRRQPSRSATREKHPNTLSELSSNNKLTQKEPVVNNNSMQENEDCSIFDPSNQYGDNIDTHHTSGMKNEEYRAVSIFTSEAHYLISADGYMSGVIVDKVSIDEYKERKYFYDNIPRADVSNFGNEENRRGQRNHSDSDITSQNEGTDSFDVELDAFNENHPEWFANKRETRSNYSRTIKKLKVIRFQKNDLKYNPFTVYCQ